MFHSEPRMRHGRKKAVERFRFRTLDGCALTAAQFHTNEPVERGILLIPPLIGASYVLFGRQFSFLVKSGYRIVSLNYRGHHPSEGLFTLRTSFEDTLALAREIKQRDPSVPISAIGMCSGSMPIFHILDQEPDLIDRLIFVNAIHHIQQTATPLRAIRMYWSSRQFKPPKSLGEAVSVVLDEVFPEIDKADDHFGILRYDRVRKPVLIREYLFRGFPNTKFQIPKPTLCCYALNDLMLGLCDPERERAYRAEFSDRFPLAEFATFDSDHFMTGLREQIARRVQTFLENGTPHTAA